MKVTCPEIELLKTIFVEDYGVEDRVMTLLKARNKICESKLFTDDESFAVSDLILSFAEDKGLISWDEHLQCYTTLDGTPIADL